MNYLDTEDNIVAIATAGGAGSVDIVRISGSCLEKLYKKLSSQNSTPKPNSIYQKNIYSLNSKKILDTCLVSYFKGPKSFTGDDVIEINTHGGGFTAQQIRNDIVDAGFARLALPGEFMFRAYYNNKIDLVQAEGINELIKSDTRLQKENALENINGKLSHNIVAVKNELITLLKIIEHELDFDENEVTHISNDHIATKIEKIMNMLLDVSKSYFFSKTIRNGIRIMILGKPNAGKSSIFNALMGHNRAIVSELAGTTRDTIEATIEIDGNRVVLVDTAGFWKGADSIEREGIKKTKEEIIRCDVVLLVAEKNSDFKVFSKYVKDKMVIKIGSKSDKISHDKSCLSISTVEPSNIGELSTAISTSISKYMKDKIIEDKYFINKRHKDCVVGCINTIEELKILISKDVERDVVANFLHVILDRLNEILSPVSRDDIINNIFSNFCIGK